MKGKVNALFITFGVMIAVFLLAVTLSVKSLMASSDAKAMSLRQETKIVEVQGVTNVLNARLLSIETGQRDLRDEMRNIKTEIVAEIHRMHDNSSN